MPNFMFLMTFTFFALPALNDFVEVCLSNSGSHSGNELEYR